MRIFKLNILTDYELKHYNDDVAYYYRKRGKELEEENFRLYMELDRLKKENINLKNHQVIKIVNLEDKER